jgi:D-apionolactonase
MEIVVPDETDAAAALAPVAAAVTRARLKLDAVVVSSAADLKSWQPGAKRPEKPSVDEICQAARLHFSGVKLGGGMLSTFTELNRKRPRAALVDYVTHTSCSIVHAADDRSVMETLETLPAIIASTRAMIGDKPYHIGPSAIAARNNPYGKSVNDNAANGRVCLTDRDPRQRGLFNAAWTLGYVAACAYGGLASVAVGAVTGPLGFIHRRADQGAPYFDAIDRPAVYPAFHVMAGLARGRGRRLIETRVSPAGRAAALAWRDGDRVVVWLANLTAEPLALRIAGWEQTGRRITIIDADSFEEAVRTTEALDALARSFEGKDLTLDAYAVARID